MEEKMNKTIQLNGNGRIRTGRRAGRTEIDVPHADRIITSVLPLVGPGKYQAVMGAISQEGLLRPTSSQTLSLVNLALQNPDEEHCKTILLRLRDYYFWTSTQNLWGNEDVIVYDNVDGKMPSDRASLIKRMKDGDKAVRAVPYGFMTGSQSVLDFVKNPYVKAHARDVPEDVVAKVAEKISRELPYVWALGPQGKDVKRYTALCSIWYDGRLYLDGYFDDVNEDGFASGVLKNE
jgi:hypothetical protein